MNSPFATIFRAIQDRIKNKATYIKHIDQELGQLKSARPPVSWPCVLIDFEDFSFQSLSENVQTAEGTVVIRLGFAPYSNTSQATPVEYAAQALAYYDMEWKLHKQLQGYIPIDMGGALCRYAATTQKRNDNYRVREIRYKLAFEDYSTKRVLRYISPDISIDDTMTTTA